MKKQTGLGSRFKALFHTIDLTQGKPGKVIFAFTLPIIFSYLFQQLYTLADAAICGQTLSSSEVAGVNDTFPLTFIFLQFAFGCTAGFCVITANKLGEHDRDGVRRSFAAQIILCLIVSVLLTGGSVLALPALLRWVGITPDNAEVYHAAYTYALIIFLGIGAQLFYNFICSILRSIGDSLTPLLFLIFSTILNVGLDVLLIVGFRMGVAGAAIATVLAQAISAAGCFVYTFLKYKELRLHKKDFKVNFRFYFDHLKQGIPLGLQFSVLAVGIIVMLGGFVAFDKLPDGTMAEGTPSQNGYGAANKMINFLMSPMSALGTAMVSYNAQNVGAGDDERVRKGMRSALLIMLAMYVVTAGIGLLLSINGAYMYLFLSADKITPATIRYGNLYLYADLPLFFILGTLFVLRNGVQGIGKSGYALDAGFAELLARIAIAVWLPPFVNGGAISAAASELSYFSLCLADPGAWLGAVLVLLFPYIHDIVRKKHKKSGCGSEMRTVL